MKGTMTKLILNYPIKDTKIVLVEGEELHYLIRVRRHKKGDAVEVRDADGRRFRARISKADRNRATLAVEEELAFAPSVWPISLIVTPPKGNLMDDVIRSLSELGVERMTPTLSERSVARPGRARVERWRRIARESRRQCGREIPLEVDPVRNFDQALDEFKDCGLSMILHPPAKAFPFTVGARANARSICIAIGPEGGFTDAEVATARDLGFEPVGLGESILRIETAAVVAAVLGVALLGGFVKT
jgi:16S rRNA (uracil1498-N3)-methyltransferase